MSRLFQHPQALMNRVSRIAGEAGEITLQFYDEAGFSGTEEKTDGSPVTQADRKAEEFITASLTEIAPDIPVVAEECFAAGTAPDIAGHDFFWLVDPLDGTREFVKGGPDFTVNIALIEKGQPVLGIVYAPVRGEMYAGHRELGAFRQLEDTQTLKDIRARHVPKGGYTVIVSSNRDYGTRLDTFLADLKVEKIVKRSSSLKICAVASGKADLYPGFGATCEWDLAAGHAILQAAGGNIFDLQGQPMTYGHAGRKFENPDFIAAKEFPFPLE